MANVGIQKKSEEKKSKLLHSAAKLFLKKGYQKTKITEIENDAKITAGRLIGLFGDKEGLLAELVAYVLEGQFKAASKFLQGKTDDKILYYAAETALQLHMAESNENIRDLYSTAYSLPKPSAVIQNTITGKLEALFKEHLPDLETKDFYMLEIASGGIIRGFMTVPCNIWFTMDKKVNAFLEATLRVYRVPETKIQEAIEFLAGFDFTALAKNAIDGMIAALEYPEETNA